MLRNSKIKKFRVFGSQVVNEAFKRATGCTNEFVEEYSMGMNILMQWFAFKHLKNVESILSLDDDIIICDDVNSLFDGKSKFKIDALRTAGRKKYKEESSEGRLIKEFFEMFNVEFDVDLYFKNYINAGHFILSKQDINVDEYERCLVNFFNNEMVREKWMKRSSHVSNQLDEKFITMLAIKSNVSNNLLHKYVEMLVNKNDKISDSRLVNCFNKRHIIHVCNKSGKDETYRRLEKLKLIKINRKGDW